MMISIRSLSAVAAVAAVALVGSAGSLVIAQQDPEAVVVAFSDPARPGKVIVQLLSGGVTVRGENRRDVSIVAGQGQDKPSVRPTPPGAAQGLRRLSQSPGFTVEEDRNEMKIESTSFRRQGGMFEIRVPVRTDLELKSVNNGVVTVENVEGDLEIENVNGPVVLTNVSGSVVANSVNGGVKAQLARVTAQKAMAFTSLNGNVDVTLPPTLKATLKMRSDQGDIFSDFDVQLRPVPSSPNNNPRATGKLRLEVNRSIYGAVNGGGPEIELRTFNGSVFLRKGQ
jgi:hypothetical protein